MSPKIETAPTKERYNFWKMVDFRCLEGFGDGPKTQIVCDLDKTYLETKFETFSQLAKIPFEKAKDKITVPGALEILNLCRWGNPLRTPSAQDMSVFPRPLHFVSSSPNQLRKVIEEKLFLDGIDWSTDTFKNQAYNIKKARFDQIRHQVAYKTAAILNIIKFMPSGSKILMFGDNVEADPVIYLGIKLFIEGVFSADQYMEYLEQLNVKDELVGKINDFIKKEDLPQCTCDGIYIRSLPGAKGHIPSGGENIIFGFDNYFQVALRLIYTKIIEPESLNWLVRRFKNSHGFSSNYLWGLVEQLAEVFDLPNSREILLDLENDSVSLKISDADKAAHKKVIDAVTAFMPNKFELTKEFWASLKSFSKEK